MGLKWLVCWIGWTSYRRRETIKWVHCGVHGPDPGSWGSVIASFAHSVATLLLKRSVSGSWQPDRLMNSTLLSAWSASSVSRVTNICICPGKVLLFVHFQTNLTSPSPTLVGGGGAVVLTVPCLSWQPWGPVLQRGHWALSQLQLSALCRAQRPPPLPGLADWGCSEQLLHLDGEEAQGTRLVVLCLSVHVHVRRAGHWALLGFN